jgi:Maltokinase N-terminal cap domain
MALLHKATVTPTKLEILDTWLPGRPWFHGAAGVEKVASYRFDDPAGEVGLEAILVSSGDEIYQVPLTYRAAPLAGADGHLVGTMEHSVLGPRWAYDACADQVWASALATAVLTGGEQAVQHIDIDGHRETLPPLMTVRGSGAAADGVDVSRVTCHDEGDATVIRGEGFELLLVRRIGADLPRVPDGADLLTGSWTGVDDAVLALIR